MNIVLEEKSLRERCCRMLNLQAIEQGLFAGLLPELYALQIIEEQNDWHTDDVYQQSVRLFQWVDQLPGSVLGRLRGHDPILERLLSGPVDAELGHHTTGEVLRFVALVHDTGKYTTLAIQDDGTTHCPGHETVGADLSPTICARFDFTQIETRFVTDLVRGHGEPYALFKAIAQIPTEHRQEQLHHFEVEHASHLLPLLLLAYGDLVTSQLEQNRPEKYTSLLDFYQYWLHSALTAAERCGN